MRTEEEMMQLIQTVIRENEHIRGALLNGSRVNPRVKKDFFQDFDLVMLVDDLDYFTGHPNWIACFGERRIMQQPERFHLLPPIGDGRLVYLMQLMDGNRIDLTLITVEQARQQTHWDSLSLVLCDKDQLLPKLPPPQDSDYWVKAPTRALFDDCCNEFWWVSTYIAKGLWRDEITYVKAMLDGPVRNMLMLMLDWYVGMRHGFQVSTGKCGKFLAEYLEIPLWEQLMKTYSDGKRENIWQAHFAMCKLFRKTGTAVAEQMGFAYPQQEDDLVMEYLRQVHGLPADAQSL